MKSYSEKMMLEAIAEANKALIEKEVPVGAVVVKDGEIIGRGYNKREYGKNALYHAEIIAINEACNKLGGWRLTGCDLFVTLEPCPMCTGAIINSRIKRVYFGGYDSKAGSLGSVTDLSLFPYNHKFEVYGGILEDSCTALLSDFFKRLR